MAGATNGKRYDGGKQGARYQKATTATQAEHKRAISRLNDDKYPNATYDLRTLKRVDYGGGYQVTFCQIGDNYSDSQYAKKVNEFLRVSSDGIASAGKYGGTPEVSFHVNDLSVAMRLAKKYNQDSVYDWQTGNCIDNPDGDGINHDNRR